MRLPNTAHTGRPWLVHELTEGFRLLDVWALPTPGGPDDFPELIALMTTSDPTHGASGAAAALWTIRRKVGALLRWDDPDLGAFPFRPLYLLDDEWAGEIVNRTVRGVMHLGWVQDESGGYRGQMAVLAKSNGLLGAVYMAAIEPFRHVIVYPQMMSAIGRSWEHRAGQRGFHAECDCAHATIACEPATNEPSSVTSTGTSD